MTNLISNPFANPLWLPLAVLLAVLFGGTALALGGLQLVRKPLTTEAALLKKPATSFEVLWQRYRTWATIGPLFGLAILSGPLILAILLAGLVWQAGQEYAKLTELPENHKLLLIGGGWLALGATLLLGRGGLAWLAVAGFFGWSALALAQVEKENNVAERFYPALAGFWGFLYTGWLPAHLLALPGGLVLVVGLGVALSDIGAFVAGKTIGGAKLAPKLSPNKTWGGAVGNLVGAGLAVTLLAFALPELTWWKLLLLTLTIAVGSVWGDLLESLLKRQNGVKDAGTLLPGFGGLLDRIDSLLIVGPLVCYLSMWVF